MSFTRGRRRTVDTQQQFCPEPDCSYYGWLARGNIRANGHPGGQAWRQLQCVSCHGYFSETHGTLLHGKRASVELIVRVITCLAEGLGIRGTARVFEIDPNTVLRWLVEAAEQLKAFAASFLHELPLTQIQLDELYAVLRAVRDGAMSQVEAIERLSRSPHWVWTAIDPETTWLLSVQGGDRTLAMAQAVLHQITQLLAPGCVPLFLSDGYAHYLTAIGTHCGHWVQTPRRQARGPAPKPQWMLLPALLYAQVVKQMRRRSATPCKSADGLGQPLILFQVCHNFVLPHTGLRQPLLIPEPTNGTGAAKVWQSCTPAIASGLTDHVWSLREVLRFRVPPWPQPQTVSNMVLRADRGVAWLKYAQM
jgi:transposase-like protein